MDNDSQDTYAIYDGAGAFQRGYTRTSHNTGPRDDFSFDLNWNHMGAQRGGKPENRSALRSLYR